METLNPQTLSGTFLIAGLIVAILPILLAIAMRSTQGAVLGLMLGIVIANLVVAMASPHWMVFVVVEVIALVGALVLLFHFNSYRHTTMADGTVVHEQGIGWQGSPSPAEQIYLAQGEADRRRLEGAASLVHAQVGMAKERRLLEVQRQSYLGMITGGAEGFEEGH